MRDGDILATENDGKALVWSDKTGTYKLGYSQFLQHKTLQFNKILLVSVIILIIMLGAAFFYGYQLIQRIDALNPLAKLASVVFL